MFILPWTAKAGDVVDDNTDVVKPVLIENADYSQLASSLVGRNITVHCEDLPMQYYGYTLSVTDGNGVTTFRPDIWLQKYVCVGLHMLLHYRPKHFVQKSTWLSDRYDLMAIAVLTITHESDHIILNSVDEGVVECYAFHHFHNTLDMFNLPRRVAREVYLSAKVLHYEGEPMYRTVC